MYYGELSKLWYPSRSEPRLRPQLVDGSVSIYKDVDTGTFTVWAAFVYDRRIYPVMRQGVEALELQRSLVEALEEKYQSVLADEVAKGLE